MTDLEMIAHDLAVAALGDISTKSPTSITSEYVKQYKRMYNALKDADLNGHPANPNLPTD